MFLPRWHGVSPCVFIFVCVSSLVAAPPRRSDKKPNRAKPDATNVEFFAAEKAGEIEVKVIAKDSAAGGVLIKNKTDKPLSIKLPDAFVGVPVAAQFGGMGGGGMGGMNGGGMGGMGGMGGGMNQAMGGGMGGMGMGGGMGGMGGGMGGMGGGGGGFFRVEPDKVEKIKIVTVCLEHGKKDPSPHVEYKLIPADSYTKNATTIEALKMLGRGEIDQRSAQAAAWNLENGKSWTELASKIGVKHLDGRTEPYFMPDHLQRGVRLVAEAERRAKESKAASSSPAVSSGTATAKQQ